MSWLGFLSFPDQGHFRHVDTGWCHRQADKSAFEALLTGAMEPVSEDGGISIGSCDDGGLESSGDQLTPILKGSRGNLAPPKA